MVQFGKDAADAAAAVRKADKALMDAFRAPGTGADQALNKTVDRLADLLAKATAEGGPPHALTEVLCGLAVRGLVTTAGELPSAAALRVTLRALDLVRPHMTEVQRAKVKSAIFLWAGGRAVLEIEEEEKLTKFTVAPERAREIRNRWSVVAWGLTHGQRVDEPLKFLGKKCCPNCGEPVEYENPYPREDDTNTPAWNGGFYCPCGWEAEDEDPDFEQQDPEPFEEATGPMGLCDAADRDRQIGGAA